MTEPKVDMTPKAVDTRLRRVEQLRQLCLSLRRAKLAQEARRGGSNGQTSVVNANLKQTPFAASRIQLNRQ